MVMDLSGCESLWGQTSNALCPLPSIDCEPHRDLPEVSVVCRSIDIAGFTTPATLMRLAPGASRNCHPKV